MRQKITTIGALLVGLLFLSLSLTASLSLIAVAQGYYRVAYTWGTPCTVADTNETTAMSDLCYNISTLIAGRPYWISQNYYNDSTDSAFVYSRSDAIRSSPVVYFLATFHVGDAYREYRSGTLHYNYYDKSGDANGIEDVDLYPHTGAKHYFTFIWTCMNGDLFRNPLNGQFCYGYNDTQNSSGIVGMPYAWTKTTGMSQDGYDDPSGSFTYIGFENISKQLKDSSEFITKNYGDFVKHFYYHAVVEHRTVNLALDHAMDDMGTWRHSFGVSELYTGYNVWHGGIEWQCKMRVYGNGDMVLPY